MKYQQKQHWTPLIEGLSIAWTGSHSTIQSNLESVQDYTVDLQLLTNNATPYVVVRAFITHFSCWYVRSQHCDCVQIPWMENLKTYITYILHKILSTNEQLQLYDVQQKTLHTYAMVCLTSCISYINKQLSYGRETSRTLILFRLTSSVIHKIMHKIGFLGHRVGASGAIYALYLKFLTQRNLVTLSLIHI